MTRPVTPGHRWRLLAHWPDSGKLFGRPSTAIADAGRFDELVVDDWLHIEQMTDRAWWMQVGDARLWLEIPRVGPPVVTIQRGEYGPVTGETITAPPSADELAALAQAVKDGAL